MDDDLRPVPRHEFAFDIERALSKALGLLANSVAEHFELCGIRCFRKPSNPGHRTPPP